MKILYIANIRIPTEKAHGIQIMKMCEAFATSGHQVHLIVPNRQNTIKDDSFSYYGIKQNFQITYLPTLDTVRWGKLGFWFQALSFIVSVRRYLESNTADLIYSRDAFVLLGIGRQTGKVFWEVHGRNRCNLSRRVADHSAGIIYLTHGLRKYFDEICGLRYSRSLVAHDGVDLEEFHVESSKEQCRQKLGLPLGKKLVLYTGHLYEYKGVYTLAEAADHLSSDVDLIFVGGTEDNVASFRTYNKRRSNVHVLGHKPHSDMPLYLKAADVLVLPNSAKDERSNLHTSPMKLFEYIASGVPIVSTDVPSVREILTENDVQFVRPDDPLAFARGIQMVLKHSEHQHVLDTAVLRKVAQYTWSRRAESILALV